MRNPASANTREGDGRQVSMTINAHRSATYWMERRVDSRLGKQIYGHRMSVVEPVFANIGTNKVFIAREKEGTGQWQLYSLVHNIERLMRYSAIGA